MDHQAIHTQTQTLHTYNTHEKIGVVPDPLGDDPENMQKLGDSTRSRLKCKQVGETLSTCTTSYQLTRESEKLGILELQL